MNATVAATILVSCNGAANVKHFGALADCTGRWVEDVGNCTGEYIECMTRAISPV